jgi:peptidyl-prolyl cis-trans isomerase A (cyclophilin A)
MTTTRRILLPAVIIAVALGSLGSGSTAAAQSEEAVPATRPALLDPSLATEPAPETFKVKLVTTKGDIVIDVVRKWAPKGADRFYNLVKTGYYDNTAFFRVIDGFMAQVGLHGDPAVTAAWSRVPIADDPVKKPNTRGMVTFAMKSSPNSRTSQFFINFGDNSYLDKSGFAPIGKVVDGMQVADSLYSGYGEGAPRGKGPSQGRLTQEGNAYLEAEFPKLDSIVQATIVE